VSCLGFSRTQHVRSRETLFLSCKYAGSLYVEEDVYLEHRKLKGMEQGEAKSRYVKRCAKFDIFGTTMFPSRVCADMWLLSDLVRKDLLPVKIMKSFWESMQTF